MCFLAGMVNKVPCNQLRNQPVMLFKSSKGRKKRPIYWILADRFYHLNLYAYRCSKKF